MQPSGQRFADDLEGQNDEALEGLTAKVKLLKDVRESSVALSLCSPWSVLMDGGLDHNRYRERSARVDRPALTDGTSP